MIEVERQGRSAPERTDIPQELPILPSKDTLVYPHMMVPVALSGATWTRLIDEAAADRRMVGLVALRDPERDATPDNLYSMGTAANIARMLKLPDGTIQVLLQGVKRIRILELTQEEPYPKARIEVIPEIEERTKEVEGLQRNLLGLFQRIVALSPTLPGEAAVAAANIEEAGRMADFIASGLNLSLAEKQEVLETLDVAQRLRKVTTWANRELEILEIGSRIQSEVKQQVDKTQREYYLREQLKAIQRELGMTDERESEINELREKIEQAGMPEEAKKESERELDRLAKMPPGSPESGYIRNYLDWMVALPWSRTTPDILDVKRAREVLDEDHYDLEKIKDRILEYLAVRKLKPDMRGPILCFVGPPGVGKTSLGQSIARALGRKFIRISLGGIRDEAEIRGHRRTYVGAMPGRIIQGIRRAETANPVFMLDEVDKLAVGFQGDPAAALLEVLDPAQNSTFVDLYLGVPFDLSQVMFIATANVLETIPPALQDRMEVIRLSGYTELEKLEIARRFLVPRQLAENGLTADNLDFTDDGLRQIIDGYTREAGVRNLEREIATICRKVARRVAEGETEHVTVTADKVASYLGPRRIRYEVAEKTDEVGVATGLAWTPAGGDVLFVEAAAVPGHGAITLTGQLGEVMQESARAAFTYARMHAEELGAPPDFYEKFDVHVHVPAGAVPKDGPSAGVTMATALISAITRRPVNKDVAMTGEITLRGRVLPIGGVKEKVLAAFRAGAKTVILPKENERDLEDVPEHVRDQLRFVFAETVDDVLKVALLPAKEPAALAETAGVASADSLPKAASESPAD